MENIGEVEHVKSRRLSRKWQRKRRRWLNKTIEDEMMVESKKKDSTCKGNGIKLKKIENLF